MIYFENSVPTFPEWNNQQQNHYQTIQQFHKNQQCTPTNFFQYQRQNIFHHNVCPAEPHEVDRFLIYPPHNWQDRNFENRNYGDFRRLQQFDPPEQVHPFHPNPRRECVPTGRGRRRLRHHLDDIYLPNYDDDSPHETQTNQYYLRTRNHRNIRRSRRITHRKITNSKFVTYEAKGDKQKLNESKRRDVHSYSSLIEISDQSAEATSSSVELKISEEISDEKTVNINRDLSTISTIANSRNEEKVKDNIVNSVTTIITIDLDSDSDSETICLDENDQIKPPRDILPVDMSRVDSTCNMQRKNILRLTTTKKDENKKPENKKKISVVSEVRNVKGSNNGNSLDQSVKPQHSSSVAVFTTKSNEKHKLSPDGNGIVNMTVLPASADSTIGSDVKITQCPTAKVVNKCSNLKHSTNVEVEKCAHLHDPRLTRKMTKSNIPVYLNLLNWKLKVTEKKDKDKKNVPEPDSPKREEISGVIEKKPSSLFVERTPSILKMDQSQIDPKRKRFEVTNADRSAKDERGQCEPPSNKVSLAQRYRKDFNPKMKVTQISNYRKEVTEIKGGKDDVHKKNEITDVSVKSSKTVTNEVEKRRRVIIRNQKAVCQYNHYVLNKFSKYSCSKFYFCCHVAIRREDYDKAKASTNYNSNFLELIDTRKSYLPQHSSGRTEKPKKVGLLPVDKIDGRKWEDSTNVTLSGEGSIKKILSDKSEQDDEIKFLAERAKKSVGKGTQDALKKKGTSAKPTGKIESKLLMKERFLKIYETKPVKVSGSAVDKLSKKSETDIAVLNCGKNKEEIKSFVKLDCTLSNKKNKKQLYDPRYDSKVSGDKLTEIFGDDLSDMTPEMDKGTKRKSIDGVDCWKGSNILKKNRESTYIESKKATARKRMSLTCEDASMPPKKICKRRSTIHLSSIFENTITAHAVPSDANSVAETIQLISEEILMTNNTHNVIHLHETEIPKNTSEDIMNILSESEITLIPHPESTQEVNSSKNENGVSSFNLMPTYFGLPDVLSENISEKTKVLSSPTVKYQRADSRLVEEELTETTEIQTTGLVIEPFIDLTSANENHENFRNVVITNVSTDVSTRVEVKSDPDEEELLLQVKITQTPQYDKEMKQEILSICELLGDVKREEVGDTYVQELPLKFATSAKEEEESWEESMECCQHPIVKLVSAVPLDVQAHYGKAVVNSTVVFFSVQKILNDTEKKKESSLPAGTSSQQAADPEKRLISYVIPTTSIEMIRKIYQRFYGCVYSILRAYIPLQRAYSGAYQLIYGMLKKFAHSLNNFTHEDVSLHLIMHDRRKYYGYLLFMDILRLPHNLPGFNFSDFLRRIVDFLHKACIEVSVPILVEHLFELIMVYDHEYKKHRTSYIFKKNIEYSLDSFISKNGSSKPGCCMTQRQRGLLKTQIMTYLQLNSTQIVYLKDMKHFQAVPFSTLNIKSKTNIVDRPITVDGTLHKTSNMVHRVAPPPIQHEKGTRGNSSFQQTVNQNMTQSNSRRPNNLQDVCHEMIEKQPLPKSTAVTWTPLTSQPPPEKQPLPKTTAVTWTPLTSQPPPSYEYSIRCNNNRQFPFSNCQFNNSSNYSRNTISGQAINEPVRQMVDNYPQMNPLSFPPVPNDTVSCTNQKSKPNNALRNKLNTRWSPYSSLIRGNMPAQREMNDKLSAKTSSSASYVMDNKKVNTIMNPQSTLSTAQICSTNSRYSSHSSLTCLNAPVTQQSENSWLANIHTSNVSVRDNTVVTPAINNSLLSKSPSSNHTHLPVIQQNDNGLTSTSTSPYSSLIRGNMPAPREMNDKLSAKSSSSAPYVMDNKKVNTTTNPQSTLSTAQICSTNSRYSSNSSLVRLNAPVTQQSENSWLSNVHTSNVSVRDNTIVTSATNGSLLSKSPFSNHTHLQVIQQNHNGLTSTSTSGSVLNNTKVIIPATCGFSLSKVSTSERASVTTARMVVPPNNTRVVISENYDRLAKSPQSSRSTNPAPPATLTINTPIVPTSTEATSVSGVAVSLSNNMNSTISSLQCHTTCSYNPTILSDTASSVTQSLGSDLLVGKTTSGILVVNELKLPNSSVNKEDSSARILQKSGKVQEHNQYPSDVMDDKSWVASGLDPYSIDLTSPPADIKGEEENERSNAGEDEIIDLTWMDDFTEDELSKDDNQDDFMYIKMEPLDDNPAVPPSPGDSGIDSPPIQMEYPELILQNRTCLCGQIAVYLCHCNTVMYCSQECQFSDWPKHRKVCSPGTN